VKKFAGALATLMLAVVPPPTVSAQSRPIGVTGGLDFARMTDDESFLGSGMGLSGGIQWRLTRATALEIEAGRERHVRDLGFHAVVYDAQGRIDAVPYTQRWEGNSTFVVGSLSHAFGTGTVRPVVWGGGGVMFDDGTERGPVTPPVVPPGFTLQPGDPQSGQDPSATAFVFDGGAGIDSRVSSRVTLRPFAGVRLAGTGETGPKYILRFGVRVAFGL
jgi:hypothetical protein